MSFTGETLVSYGTPIAKIYRNKRGALVLMSEHSYSASTSKHLSHARSAVSHMECLRVPRYIIGSHGEGRYRYSVNAKDDHTQNFAFLVKGAADHLASARRALRVYAVQWRRDAAKGFLRDAQRYSDFFGLRRKAPSFPELEWNGAAARAERIENPDPHAKDARERARAARIERTRERDEYLTEQRRSMQAARHARDFFRVSAARSSFRLGDAFGQDYEALRSSPCMLRADADDIETSWGARVPLAAAPMVWAMVQRQLGRGWSAKSDGLVRRVIGDYPLDRIDEDGTLHAGCHVIPYSELAMLAHRIGLAP